MEFEKKFRASHDGVGEKLESMGFSFVGEKHQIDTYFYDEEPMNNGSVWFRVRSAGGKYRIAYHFRSPDADFEAEELESDISDGAMFISIMEKLGLSVCMRVDKKRMSYKKGDVTVELDLVEGLGEFIEIEIIGEDASDAGAKIAAIEKALMLTERVNDAYPTLLRKET